MRLLSLCFLVCAACGGGVAGTSDPAPSSTTDPGTTTPQPPSTVVHPPAIPPTTTTPPSAPGTISSCPNPTSVLVPANGTLKRPAGKTLRLELAYQGTEIGIRTALANDSTLAPSDGPFTAGAVSGYWVEIDTTESTLYQKVFQDPTVLEAPGPPGTGGFSNSTADVCQVKTFEAELPNDLKASTVRVYGSPYGTQNPAVLLGQFTLVD